MTPRRFKEMTYVKEHVPVFRDHWSFISKWRLTWAERLRLLFTGTLWLTQKHNGQPLQRPEPSVEEPFGQQ